MCALCVVPTTANLSAKRCIKKVLCAVLLSTKKLEFTMPDTGDY